MIASATLDLSSLPTQSIENLIGLPSTPGVYFFHIGGRVLYVGKTKSIKTRITCHQLRSKLRTEYEGVSVSWMAAEEDEIDTLELQYAYALKPPLNRAIAKYDGSKYWWAMPEGFSQECSRRSKATQDRRKLEATKKKPKGRLHCRLAILMASQYPVLSKVKLSTDTGIDIKIIRRLFYSQIEQIDVEIVETLCDYFDCGIGELFERRKD